MEALSLAALVALPFINWPLAITLLRLSRQRPYIRALSERAGLATIIAIVTTVYVAVAINSHLDFALFDAEAARVVVRSAIFVIGLYPLYWVWAYYTGRFRDRLADDDPDVQDAAREGPETAERPRV